MLAAYLLCGVAALSTELAAVGHHGVLHNGTVEWETRIVSWRGDPQTFRLARPLTHDGVWQSGVVAERDALGAVVAIRVEPHAWDLATRGRHVAVIRTREAVPDVDGAVVLHPPLLLTSAVQRVVLEGPVGLVFTPDPSLGIEHRIGAYASAAMGDDEMRAADDALAVKHRRPWRQAIYLRADDEVMRSGLSGQLSTQASRRGSAVVVAGGLFVALLGALALAYSRWRKDAEVARAEKIIAGEYDGL